MAKNFRNLVFEGGGVKGIAYGGALQVLHEAGILQNVKRVAGTSAGAITAVLLAVGYSHQETGQIIAETNFNSFADDSAGALRDTKRLFSDFGLHKGNFFLEWIGDYIVSKTGDKDITFRQLKEAGHALELFLVGTNLSKQRTEIYSHEHTPDLAIREAARMSMSIPLYFRCVRSPVDGDVIVDGGVSLNYAVNIFDHKQYVDDTDNIIPSSVAGTDHGFNFETLGFRLDTKEEIDLNKRDWGNPPKQIDNILDYTVALVNFMHVMSNKRHLNKLDWGRTVFVDTADIQSTDFDLGPDQISLLVENGRTYTEKYLDWRLNVSDYNKPV